MCVKQAKRLAIYLVGLMILTCGQRLFVQAGLGAGAFDSLCVGVSQYNSISAGTWVTIGSFILMLVSAALENGDLTGGLCSHLSCSVSFSICGVQYFLLHFLLS